MHDAKRAIRVGTEWTTYEEERFYEEEFTWLFAD